MRQYVLKISKAGFMLLIGLTGATATFIGAVVAYFLPSPLVTPTITFVTTVAMVTEVYFMTKEQTAP
jgi:hypothetical protein